MAEFATGPKYDSTLTQFYRDLVGILKTRISLAPSVEAEDEGEDESGSHVL